MPEAGPARYVGQGPPVLLVDNSAGDCLDEDGDIIDGPQSVHFGISQFGDKSCLLWFSDHSWAADFAKRSTSPQFVPATTKQPAHLIKLLKPLEQQGTRFVAIDASGLPNDQVRVVHLSEFIANLERYAAGE